MSAIKYSRQLDIIKPENLDFKTLVIGAGGIGSWVTLALAKMGCSDITVLDFDSVEDVNIPSQVYGPDDIGLFKAVALADKVKLLSGQGISGYSGRFQDFYKAEDECNVIIVAVDSLQQRQEIWNQISKTPSFSLIVDARMASELIRILTVVPTLESVSKYTKGLFNPASKPHVEKCTERAVAYNTMACGALVAAIVKKWANHEPVPTETIFDITSMVLTTNELTKGGEDCGKN